MNAKIAVIVLVLVMAGHAANAQTPPLYVPRQAPATPQYAPAAAPPAQPVHVQPVPQQPTQMYDKSYKGPYNMYGQPVITGYQRQQNMQQDQSQMVHNGLLPRVLRGAEGLGGYLWSYMPAPVRGVGSPYDVAPGEAQHTVTVVPGSP
ncbi:MAG: hypothetical protein RDU20_08765 [Desulfomonilaceae bacterium]|nr:hypothetical protein [Desulfomonilaceae bacterium]